MDDDQSQRRIVAVPSGGLEQVPRQAGHGHLVVIQQELTD